MITEKKIMDEEFPLKFKVTLNFGNSEKKLFAVLSPIAGVNIVSDNKVLVYIRPAGETEFGFILTYIEKSSRTLRNIEINFFDAEASSANPSIALWKGDVTVGQTDPQKHVVKNLEGQQIGQIQPFIFYTKVREDIKLLKESSNLEFQLTVAIDFTLSNDNTENNPTRHGLHDEITEDGVQFTEYSRCIAPVCNLLSEAGGADEIYCWGFGGLARNYNYGNNAQDRSIFNLSLDEKQDRADGYDQLMAWYNKVKDIVDKQPYTTFTPIINKFLKAHEARISSIKQKGKMLYSILVIMTDGAVFGEELEETVEAIFRCLDYKISIIILGIGEYDFTSMRRLDGDAHPDKPDQCSLRKKNGEFASRDIVQFVKCEDFKDDPESIIKYALEELPTHITEALKDEKIK